MVFLHKFVGFCLLVLLTLALGQITDWRTAACCSAIGLSLVFTAMFDLKGSPGGKCGTLSWSLYSCVTNLCISLLGVVAFLPLNTPLVWKAVLFATLFSFGGAAARWSWAKRNSANHQPHNMHLLFFIASQIFVLRLLATSTVQLITEEAYYWKYAENLALSYLDHPPLVAWCILLGQYLFGINEFAARSTGTLIWFGIVAFSWQLTRAWFPGVSWRMVVISALLLPFPLSTGFLMTPDTPLALMWIMTLYFLHRALIEGERTAWIFVGISLGLALLAKYPAVLLGASIPVFMILDRSSRQLLLHPMPYLAAILALVVFSPVLVWNYQNEWASFLFQSSRRFAAEREFSPHYWCVFLILTLTPVGLAVLWTVLRRVDSWWDEGRDARIKLFIIVFTSVPLCAFGYASLSQEIKVNWLGPASLACVPLMAASLSHSIPSVRSFPRGWLTVGVIFSLSLSTLLSFLTVGLPHTRTPKALRKFIGWDQLAAIANERRLAVETATQTPSIIVGADSHYVPSEIGFYGAKQMWPTLPPRTEGRFLVGKHSLMYAYWSHPEQHAGHHMILVSRTESDVTDTDLARFFDSLGPVESVPVIRDGVDAATFYLRVGYHYRANALSEK